MAIIGQFLALESTHCMIEDCSAVPTGGNIAPNPVASWDAFIVVTGEAVE